MCGDEVAKSAGRSLMKVRQISCKQLTLVVVEVGDPYVKVMSVCLLLVHVVRAQLVVEVLEEDRLLYVER